MLYLSSEYLLIFQSKLCIPPWLGKFFKNMMVRLLKHALWVKRLNQDIFTHAKRKQKKRQENALKQALKQSIFRNTAMWIRKRMRCQFYFGYCRRKVRYDSIATAKVFAKNLLFLIVCQRCKDVLQITVKTSIKHTLSK